MTRTDLTSHHIQGYARAALEAGKPGHFDVPLVSHIQGNLWVGGCIGGYELPDDFRSVFSLYKWEQYRLGPDTARIEVTMYDNGDEPDADVVDDIAWQVHDATQVGKTLVHCQAGLNRSNLIAARALMFGGMTAPDAIALLRERRSSVVLCNETFERWLLERAA